MLSEWLSPGSLIAVAGLAVSLVSLRYVVRVDRRQRGEDRPTISLTIEPLREAPGWFGVRISVVNGTDTIWSVEQATLRRTHDGRILEEEQAIAQGALGREFDAALLEARAGASTDLNVLVHAAGSTGSMLSWGDRAHTLVFFKPEPSVSRLSMRLSLRPMDERARPITIDVARTLPATARIATD